MKIRHDVLLDDQAISNCLSVSVIEEPTKVARQLNQRDIHHLKFLPSIILLKAFLTDMTTMVMVVVMEMNHFIYLFL